MNIERLIERLNSKHFLINKDVVLDDVIKLIDIEKPIQKSNFLIYYVMNLEMNIEKDERLRIDAVDRYLNASVNDDEIKITLV